MKLQARRTSPFLLMFSIAACGGMQNEPAGNSLPDGGSSAAPVADGGTAPPSSTTDGGTPTPPVGTVDGAAWFINNLSADVGAPPSPNIDFGALQNTVQGATKVGDTRTAQEFVYNTSRKTPLTLTEIAIVGPAAGDFTIAPVGIALALNVPIPANKSAAVILQITFSPSAEGVRTATLRLVSNAGTALVSLKGAGLPQRPIISVTAAALGFVLASAPSTLQVYNNGGDALVLQSIAFGGANPSSFKFTVANRGFGNCYSGITMGPQSFCDLGVGVAAGAVAPSSALLIIRSNDPVQPEKDISLNLAP